MKILGVVSLWCDCVLAAPAGAPAADDELQTKNLKSFETVWTIIRDKHFDPTLGGLDWQAIHDEFRPKIEQSASVAQCRRQLQQMIGRLGQSHFAIIPGDIYDAIRKDEAEDKADATKPKKKSGRDTPGFDVRVVDGHVLVVKVDDEHASARLGIRPGWEVLQVGGEDMPALVQKTQKAVKSKHLGLELSRAVAQRLQGRAGDKIKVVFRDGQDTEVPLQVPLTKPKGTASTFGNLPTVYVTYESRKIDKTIGYFYLSMFFDPPRVLKALEESVRENLQSDGFIVDLRGNPGGLGAMAMGVGGWFMQKPEQKLGTMTTREGALNFVLFPRAQTFDGPLAILVDDMSASTSEILAGGLQDLKRARVFGTRTAGAALPSTFVLLPNGDRFQYAFASYVSVGGKALEGNGVTPDIVVTPTREALLAGGDPVLNAAVEWIRGEKKK